MWFSKICFKFSETTIKKQYELYIISDREIHQNRPQLINKNVISCIANFIQPTVNEKANQFLRVCSDPYNYYGVNYVCNYSVTVTLSSYKQWLVMSPSSARRTRTVIQYSLQWPANIVLCILLIKVCHYPTFATMNFNRVQHYDAY